VFMKVCLGDVVEHEPMFPSRQTTVTARKVRRSSPHSSGRVLPAPPDAAAQTGARRIRRDMDQTFDTLSDSVCDLPHER